LAKNAAPPKAAGEARRAGANHLGKVHCGEAPGVDPEPSAQCHKALTEWFVRSVNPQGPD
jgi:hypothetical protein